MFIPWFWLVFGATRIHINISWYGSATLHYTPLHYVYLSEPKTFLESLTKSWRPSRSPLFMKLLIMVLILLIIIKFNKSFLKKVKSKITRKKWGKGKKKKRGIKRKKGKRKGEGRREINHKFSEYSPLLQALFLSNKFLFFIYHKLWRKKIVFRPSIWSLIMYWENNKTMGTENEFLFINATLSHWTIKIGGILTNPL